MATTETSRALHRPSFPRLWIRETLVVLGVLAFGYFAVFIDTSPLQRSPATEQSAERR